ncbi:hypothetical protein RhiirA5_433072 [Rhizophagus irregularis]|uniref:Uncharacterized protein n=1 Tax=Rhizophagus irregularis TaxID=588596 RepID=A0A2N0NSD1_9GLOM|nr:hypothetical protein RhiirA5_433072 [Rhizophagus irregularis]
MEKYGSSAIHAILKIKKVINARKQKINADAIDAIDQIPVELIELLIPDVDEYTWIYHHMYSNAKKFKLITYYYCCSQCESLAKKVRKHYDPQKHQIKHLLHATKPNVSIQPEIKQFIFDNIDLLPREIYKRLIECGLDIKIRQKQVHFWWTEL